jgi:hypothetical protein
MEMKALEKQDCKNDVTVINPDGTTTKYVGYNLVGQNYILQDDGTGKRLVGYGENDGVVKYDDWDETQWSQYDRHNAVLPTKDGNKKINCKGTATVTMKTKKLEDPIKYEPAYIYCPPPYYPPRPSFIYFNEQPPTFSSDLKKVNKYSYFFGLDKLSIKDATVNQNCCFVSQDISLGEIPEDGYIQLETEFSTENNSAVEFYIIDGSTEVPILPVNQNLIQNEKIFFGLTTRFAIDESKGYEIKRNGIIADMTLDKAMQSTDALYTITYTPTASFNYKPINSSVKVKTILRVYDKNANSPYVTKMKIRKFGGGTLWKQDMSAL